MDGDGVLVGPLQLFEEVGLLMDTTFYESLVSQIPVAIGAAFVYAAFHYVFRRIASGH